MRTFVFSQKNSGASMIISAKNLKEAEEELDDYLKSSYGWRVDDEEGEEEDEEDDVVNYDEEAKQF